VLLDVLLVVRKLRVDVPEPFAVRIIVVALRLALGGWLVTGEIEIASPIVPEKPYRLVRVIVEVVVEPLDMLVLVGLVVMEKSPTFTEIVSEWEICAP